MVKLQTRETWAQSRLPRRGGGSNQNCTINVHKDGSSFDDFSKGLESWQIRDQRGASVTHQPPNLTQEA